MAPTAPPAVPAAQQNSLACRGAGPSGPRVVSASRVVTTTGPTRYATAASGGAIRGCRRRVSRSSPAPDQPDRTRSSQLLLHLLVAVFELINASSQATSLVLNGVEVLRQLHQALVGHDALDARNTSVEIVQLDLNRILIRWS